jgi:hypothetical protein
VNKQEALAKLQGGFDELMSAVSGLDDAAMTRVFYGTWSVKDIIAHIAGWQHQMAAAMERMARGERPAPEGVDYSDSDTWNARFASAMEAQSPATVVADLRQSFATYKRAAQGIPEDRWGDGKTINRIVETSGYGHYREHLPAIVEMKKDGA